MPLENSCKNSVGQELFVLPYYGHGWRRKDAGAPPATRTDSIGPEPFRMVVGECVYCGKDLMGVLGRIIDPAHSLSGYWCVACLRMVGDFNFGSNPGDYMVWIARNRPVVSPATELAIYEWVTLDKSEPCLCGYGAVADSPQRVRDLMERVLNTRRQVTAQEGGCP